MGRRTDVEGRHRAPWANAGALDSLNDRNRCGRSWWARQMRWTELTETATAAAMAPAVQCVASCGGAMLVKAITDRGPAAVSGRMRDGPVLSRTRPRPLGDETLLPAPYTGLGLAGLAHHGIGSEAGGGEKHNPRHATRASAGCSDSVRPHPVARGPHRLAKSKHRDAPEFSRPHLRGISQED